MTLGNRIAALRKQAGLTQEALAQKLGVTNQAVSKWESDQCCPDVLLLPKIADEFGQSLDALFGRETAAPPAPEEAPEEEEVEDIFHIRLFRGNTWLEDYELARQVEIIWTGPLLNVQSDFAVSCENVSGDVNAGGSVNCDAVDGDVNAGGNVSCDDVGGNIKAGGNVSCDDVAGDVIAGGDVNCDVVAGSVTAGRNVNF